MSVESVSSIEKLEEVLGKTAVATSYLCDLKFGAAMTNLCKERGIDHTEVDSYQQLFTLPNGTEVSGISGVAEYLANYMQDCGIEAMISDTYNVIRKTIDQLDLITLELVKKA